MNTLLADIRYALRQFRLSPVFTLTAVLTLALGIGGTTAIFSLIHTVMLRSLPVADPGRLYRIGEGNDCCVQGGPQDKWGMYSYPLFKRLRASAPEFEQVAAFQAGGWRYGVRRAKVDKVATSLRGELVTGNYFSVFGVRSFAGRLFSDDDDRPSASPVAVISYHVWQDTYGGDPSVIGSSFIVEGQPFTVVGVAPPGFFGETLRSDPPDIWVPLEQEPLIRGDGSLLHQSMSAWLRAIGRLKPGASVDGLSPRLTGVLRQWLQYESGYPAMWMPEIVRSLPTQVVNVIPAGNGVGEMKENYSRSLQILLCVCGVVLLIACANVANLLLARGMARRTQSSLRLAIGASRKRLMVQSLVESVLLSVAGAAAGLLVADGAGRIILAIAFRTSRSLPFDTSPSWPVLGFTFALSLLTAVLFGTAPAWFASRVDPAEALRGASRSTRDTSSFSRNALLIVQATLSVVLVAGAGMLARSLNNLEHQDLGLKTDQRIAVSLLSPAKTYSPERLDALYRSLEVRLKQIPGVQQASLSLYNPLTDNWGELVLVEGRPNQHAMSSNNGSSWDRVSTSHFKVVGQPIVRGREFTEADNARSAPVAIVSEAFVRRFFANEDPLDKRFGLNDPAYASTFRIVGVVRDAKYSDVKHPAGPMFFLPLAQYVTSYKEEMMKKLELNSHFIQSAMLVTSMAPGQLEPLLRRAVAEIDPNMTVNSVLAMRQEVALQFDQERAVANLAGLFGVVALLLAAIGLYGVTAYAVAQRTSEIGIRMALGANKPNVMRLVLSDAFRKVAFGLLLGIPLAIGAGQLISAQLYGISSWDPIALAMAVSSLALCAFIAAIVPATRAASIEPMRALRTE